MIEERSREYGRGRGVECPSCLNPQNVWGAKILDRFAQSVWVQTWLARYRL